LRCSRNHSDPRCHPRNSQRSNSSIHFQFYPNRWSWSRARIGTLKFLQSLGTLHSYRRGSLYRLAWLLQLARFWRFLFWFVLHPRKRSSRIFYIVRKSWRCSHNQFLRLFHQTISIIGSPILLFLRSQKLSKHCLLRSQSSFACRNLKDFEETVNRGSLLESSIIDRKWQSPRRSSKRTSSSLDEKQGGRSLGATP
jgi:hypothetical protein